MKELLGIADEKKDKLGVYYFLNQEIKTEADDVKSKCWANVVYYLLHSVEKKTDIHKKTKANKNFACNFINYWVIIINLFIYILFFLEQHSSIFHAFSKEFGCKMAI